MGGGNGQKSMAKKLKNNAKLAKQKKGKGGGGGNAAVKFHKCKRCMQTFAIHSTKQAELVVHCDSKHPAQDFAFSFPNFAKDKAEAYAAPEVKKNDGPKKKKKKYIKRG
mmetsp:Transcript_27569/g.24432  ORF Transcript_27569/g.24432 Transcript_27569/m.24432 type:complete len:109 (+) Transcript_27569:38-364(+)